jgi:hypothetical protein
MKSFRNFIKEEVLPTAQVVDGSIDIEKPNVRAAINAAIAGVTSQPAITPYITYVRISKLLSRYHIALPRRFMEGDKGVEVFDVRQFGVRMGMTNDGEFVSHVPTKFYLFLRYNLDEPHDVSYVRPTAGGMYQVSAKLVDEVELGKLLSQVETSLKEDAEHRQKVAKLLAPREQPRDISTDGSPSTKDDVAIMMRKKDKKLSASSLTNEQTDEDDDGTVNNDEKKKQVQNELSEERKRTASVADAFMSGQKANQRTLRTDGKSVTYHGNTIAKHEGDEVHVSTAGHSHSPSTRGHINGILSRLGSDKLSVKKGQLHHGKNPVDHDAWIKVKKPQKATFGEEQIDEKAPPGAKFERMVKHIKKGYSKGGLTSKEKSIAYATAWKAKKRQDEELKFDPSSEIPKNT